MWPPLRRCHDGPDARCAHISLIEKKPAVYSHISIQLEITQVAIFIRRQDLGFDERDL